MYLVFHPIDSLPIFIHNFVASLELLNFATDLQVDSANHLPWSLIHFLLFQFCIVFPNSVFKRLVTHVSVNRTPIHIFLKQNNSRSLFSISMVYPYSKMVVTKSTFRNLSKLVKNEYECFSDVNVPSHHKEFDFIQVSCQRKLIFQLES